MVENESTMVKETPPSSAQSPVIVDYFETPSSYAHNDSLSDSTLGNSSVNEENPVRLSSGGT